MAQHIRGDAAEEQAGRGDAALPEECEPALGTSPTMRYNEDVHCISFLNVELS